jgi:hypothetical protein
VIISDGSVVWDTTIDVRAFMIRAAPVSAGSQEMVGTLGSWQGIRKDCDDVVSLKTLTEMTSD